MLQTHKKIALDFDGTLIKGPGSLYLHNLIINNFKNADFYIVTFRSHGMQHTIFEELELWCLSQNVRVLEPYMFKGIRNISNEMYEDVFPFKEQAAEYMHLKEVKTFCEWKGKMAASLGCTVLVDDQPELVQYGCQHHGVEFVNVLDLPDDA